MGESSNNRRPMTQETKISAVGLTGSDPGSWNRGRSRFIERLVNSFKKHVLRKTPNDDGATAETADAEISDTVDDMLESLRALARRPLLANIEKQAEIQKKLEEMHEHRANARKTNLEADLLELEIKERERSLEYISALMAQGKLSLDFDGKEFGILYMPTKESKDGEK